MVIGRGGGFRMLLAVTLIIALCGFALPGAWAAPIAGQELVAPPIVVVWADSPSPATGQLKQDLIGPPLAVAPTTGFTKAEAWHLLCEGATVRQAHWPPGVVWWMATQGFFAYCTFTLAPEGNGGSLGLGFVFASLRLADDTPDWTVVVEEVADDGK